MQWKRTLAKILVYTVLELGSLLGVPIRPDDIEELARRMNNAVEEAARPEEDPSGDPPE